MLGAVVSLYMQSVAGAWQLLLGVGAGTGAVYLLRWYWWRINAWSEVSAMTAAALVTALLHTWIHIAGSEADVFAKSILLTVAVTTLVWVVVTFLTAPEPDSKLLEFYRRVRPGVTGWKHVAAQKLVLNMLSTATMVRLGRVLSNWMIAVQLTNRKLRKRGQAILMKATGVSAARAAKVLEESGGNLPVALLMLLKKTSKKEAAKLLREAPSIAQVLRRALAER